MAEENQDANTQASSSNASGTGQQTGGQGTQALENQQSDQTQSSQDDGPSNPQLLEVAQRAYEESVARNPEGQSSADNNGQSGPQSGQDGQRQASSANGQQGTQQDGKQGQQQGQQATQANGKADEQVPFHNHPRWQEMLQQRDGLEQRLTQLKPIEDHYTFHRSYMERYGITDQDVANAMEFMAMQRTNPARALEMLKPIQEQLREFDPNVLPKDLQALVESNDLTPTAAKMFAQERAEKNALKRQMQSQEASRQVMNNQATSNAIKSWDMSKRGTDPDYKPKLTAEADDGLWEMTAKNFAYIQTTKFANSPVEVTANLEQAYKEAKRTINRLATARAPIRNPVTSSQSSTASAKQKPKNVYDVTKLVAAQHGINYTPPSDESED